MIRCGMHEADITPKLGSHMPGYFEARYASGVKDPLYAKSLAIESGDDAAVIVVLDAINVARSLVARVRERIRAEIGIEPERVFISATHTHTGGPVTRGFNGAADESYIEWLAERAADCAIMAYRGRREVRIGFGRGEERDISFNRRFFMKDGSFRTNPGVGNPNIDRAAGPIDPEVAVMRIDDLDGNPIGIVTNFACHTDTVGGTELCADFPGELSRFVKRSLGESTVSLFMLGACGNINHVDVSGRRVRAPGYYKWMGRVLGAEVLKVREKIIVGDTAQIASAMETITVGLRSPDEAALEQAKRQLETAPAGSVDAIFARETLKMAEDPADSASIEVQTLQIGELAVVGFPAEVFVEFGLEVKRRSPFPFTMIETLCNGSVSGYICTKEAYSQGGYEPRAHTRSRLCEDAGERMAECAVELLNRLH